MSLSGGTPIPVGVMLMSAGARLPAMSSPFSVGYDLYACQSSTIDAYDRCLISTGVSLDIPVCGFILLLYFLMLSFSAGILEPCILGHLWLSIRG